MSSPLYVLDTMREFRCNLAGCCCKGWLVAFGPDDLSRLLEAFTQEERDRWVQGWRFFVEPEGNRLEKFQFAQSGPESACQFLSGDGRCGLQVEKGEAVLPRLCRTFPAFAHDGADGIVLHFDAVCPEVMERLDAGTGPIALVEVDREEYPDLAYRAARPLVMPSVRIGARELSAEELGTVRRRITDYLREPAGPAGPPAIDRLAAIASGMRRIAEGGEPAQLDVAAESGPEVVAEFEAYLHRCVAIHQGTLLARMYQSVRRFVFAMELPELDTVALRRALAFDPTWPDRLDLRDPELQPFLLRYLTHRYHGAFARSPLADELSFTYGTVVHTFATGVRCADAVGRILDRPLDRTALKVGLQIAEYVYRTIRTPAVAMPWFY